MLVLGAGGHATEILDELIRLNQDENLNFYDDKTPIEIFQKKYRVLKSENDLKELYNKNFNFILGIGTPLLRKSFVNKFENIGGKLIGIISKTALIGQFNIQIDPSVDIMSNVNISSNIKIGKGTLINRHVSIHHDCKIGEYCEIAPGAIILGNVQVNDMSFIGAGALILPNLKIGSNCIIAAGAVVTKNVTDNSFVKGVPAKLV